MSLREAWLEVSGTSAGVRALTRWFRRSRSSGIQDWRSWHIWQPLRQRNPNHHHHQGPSVRPSSESYGFVKTLPICIHGIKVACHEARPSAKMGVFFVGLVMRAPLTFIQFGL